jgi:hypothetical protein
MAMAYFIFGNNTYQWSGYYGCQLKSFEWRRVPAGTERVLDFGIGKDPVNIRVFTTERVGLKIETTWSVCPTGSIDEHKARIESLRSALRELV